MDDKDKVIAAQAAHTAELEAIILAKDAVILNLEQRWAKQTHIVVTWKKQQTIRRSKR